MKDRILKKDNLRDFLNKLVQSFHVIAPIRQNNHSLYKSIEKAEDVCLDYRRPLKSAKEIFFPQNEVMFYFNQRTQKLVESVNREKKTILFGVPPCDLAGIAAQDRLFTTGAFQDVYYLRRRKQTILVGLGCPEPDDTCFCHLFEIDRLASSITDLFLTPIGDRYFIKVQTEQGEQLVENLPEASPEDSKALDDLKNKPVEFKIEFIPLKDVIPFLRENFDSPVWDEISKRCIGCAACTFVCPTCHCFDITDDVKKGMGRRVRTWDGCMFPKFTLHASGHNPRTAAAQRMRQRFLHKFSYFVDNQGVISCTGCGRCIAVCPVNMDIRETLKKLIEAASEPSKK
jgi:sulfhydrogenase subunit beta (sulfur reductase)